MRLIKIINLFMLFLIAPFLGFIIAINQDEQVKLFNTTELALPVSQSYEHALEIKKDTSLTYEATIDTKAEVKNILEFANLESKEYQAQMDNINEAMATSKEQTDKSDIVLEQVLSNLLGEPIAVHDGDNSTIKIYTLVEAGYRGYMAKVTPHTSQSLELVLANDKLVSNGETTSQAAKRTGAILAVNGGGFMNTAQGLTPLGTTIVNGEIKIFSTDPKLSVVGFNKSGHLVGGKYNSKQEIIDDEILQGSSFRPTLLENGKKVKISSDLANTKHPRTIIGNFSNGDLLFIVIDGRRDGWSNGVTLTEVQDKLLSFKIKDAYNLDGGGSSAFYYDGKILNKPSDGKERKVASNIIILP